MEKITSRDNSRLKYARKVRDGKSDDHIFVEGLRLSEEVFRSPLDVRECFFTPGFAATERGKALLAGIPADRAFQLSDDLLRTTADTIHSQGIILICARPPSDKSSFESRCRPDGSQLPLVIFLTEINNPSNLGAVSRTAEAAGAAGIVTSRGSSDVFSAKSLRSAMGSSFRLPVWQNAEFDEVLSWANEREMAVTAVLGSGERPYTEIDWKRPRILIFGSEGHGLPQEKIVKAPETIRIPLDNNVESLNLAVACGIVLFEARRQMPLSVAQP